MSIINDFLLNNINIIINNISKLNNNNSNNKLFQKKIEYINFYINNISQELDELLFIQNNNLFKNHQSILNEYNKYINMEKYINNHIN